MHLEKAYSLQLGQFITAERAYELFWAGVINDKRAFQCPGDNCTAQVTCANLDAAEHDLKVQPHYRPYGEHSNGCPFAERALSSSTATNQEGHGIGTLAAETPDVFNLSRPADHFTRLSVSPLSSRGARKANSGNRAQDVGRSRQRQYYSVTNLVQRWLRFRRQNLLSEAEIRIGGATVTYRQLFKGVYNQDAEALEGVQHIYWGKAWAKRLANDTGYRIEFNEKMKADGSLRRPSLLVMDDMIERYPIKDLIAKRIAAAVDENNGGCLLFVFGSPIVVPDLESATAMEPYTRCFINFRVPSLDMLDIQNLSLFDQLKRKR